MCLPEFSITPTIPCFFQNSPFFPRIPLVSYNSLFFPTILFVPQSSSFLSQLFSPQFSTCCHNSPFPFSLPCDSYNSLSLQQFPFAPHSLLFPTIPSLSTILCSLQQFFIFAHHFLFSSTIPHLPRSHLKHNSLFTATIVSSFPQFFPLSPTTVSLTIPSISNNSLFSYPIHHYLLQFSLLS